MTDWHTFDCPACPAAFEVDGPARRRLLEAGCVRCGVAVTRAAFTPLESPPQVVA